MKMKTEIRLDIKEEAVDKALTEAARKAMRDTVLEIHRDAVKGSPWLTGNNRRSIVGEASTMGVVAGQGSAERQVNDAEIEGAVYSSSGYGGFLEVGTSKMPARPYIKPATEKHFTAEKFARKVKGELE